MPRAAPRPRDPDHVDDRRRAVAAAETLSGLVAAHGDVDALLATPYGAALCAHRQDVLGHTDAELAAELDALRS